MFLTFIYTKILTCKNLGKRFQNVAKQMQLGCVKLVISFPQLRVCASTLRVHQNCRYSYLQSSVFAMLVSLYHRTRNLVIRTVLYSTCEFSLSNTELYTHLVQCTLTSYSIRTSMILLLVSVYPDFPHIFTALTLFYIPSCPTFLSDFNIRSKFCTLRYSIFSGFYFRYNRSGKSSHFLLIEVCIYIGTY